MATSDPQSKSSFRPILLALICAFSLTGAPGLNAAIYRVGSGGAPCTHTALADALLAAAVNPGTDEIWLSRDIVHTGEYFIESPVRITGGYDSCSDSTSSGQTSITRPFDKRVFTVQNNAGLVVFEDLRLHYDPASTAILDEGGMIHLSGDSNILLLQGTSVANGRAADGGGVFVDGARLILTGGSVVAQNRASFNGGGVFCTMDGSVEIDDGSVALNEADYGGGILLTSGCTGYAGPSDPFEGIVENLAHQQGGGLFMGAGTHFELLGNPVNPAIISGNYALEGGGLYAIGTGALFEAKDAHIVDNAAAVSGGGAYITSGAVFTMDRSQNAACHSARCSALSRNTARSPQAAGGGGGLLVEAGFALINQTYIEDNTAPDSQAGAILLAQNSELYLEGVVVAGNSNSIGGIVVLESNDYARIGFSTFGRNSPPTFTDSGVNPLIEIFSSILYDDLGGAIYGGGGPPPAHIMDCTIVNSTLSLTDWTVSGSLEANPQFISSATGNYHLSPGSPAIDYCDTAFYTPSFRDIDDEVRGFDAINVNTWGPYDLGADEYVLQPLFADGFESGDTGAWNP